MGSERDAEWYDMGYSQPDSKYQLSAEECGWYPIWKAVAGLVRKGPILDLGCGPGHLAEVIGPRPGYVGVDFSQIALFMAKQRCPWATWVRNDIKRMDLPLARVVVATEVLEHVRTDLKILRKVAQGTQIVLSVPSYDSKGHVRHFESMDQVVRRYRAVMRIDESMRVGERHFVISGIRNGEG